MNSPPDATVVFLTGNLTFILIAGALLALPAAFFLLWLYQRAVVRGMQEHEQANEEAIETVHSEPLPSGAGELKLLELDREEQEDGGGEGGELFRRGRGLFLR